jgi:hypothetical protein
LSDTSEKKEVGPPDVVIEVEGLSEVLDDESFGYPPFELEFSSLNRSNSVAKSSLLFRLGIDANKVFLGANDSEVEAKTGFFLAKQA